jgi:hypothetical protein
MRVACPCCKKKFDVPHRAVLDEAAKLKENHKGKPRTVDNTGPEVNGNVLPIDDAEAKRLRDEAIRRRLERTRP